MANLISMPSNDNLTDTNYYRGIAISSLITKILNKMIYKRIKDHIENILRPNQNATRPGRSTASLILTIRKHIEGTHDLNISDVLTFINFVKAYDTINRATMIDILDKCGIPEIVLKTIKLLYSYTWAKVVTNDGITEAFEVNTGILQGDTLAPYFLSYAYITA